MAGKPTIVTDQPAGDVAEMLSRVEALARIVAEHGHGRKVIKAFSLVQNTGAMEVATRKLRAAT